MFLSRLKIAIRNHWKSKVFSGVNIMGLRAGMVAVMPVVPYVDFGTSHDRMHGCGDAIFRAARANPVDSLK